MDRFDEQANKRIADLEDAFHDKSESLKDGERRAADDVQNVVDTAREKAEWATDAGTERAQRSLKEGYEKGRETWVRLRTQSDPYIKDALDRSRQGIERGRLYFREKPGPSFGVTLLIGFILGSLVAGRGKN